MLRGTQFSIDFLLLDLEGCDAVLGMQWLCTLGPIWWGFAKLLMSIQYKNHRLKLRGIKGPRHKVVEDRVATKDLFKRKSRFLCQFLPTRSQDPQGLSYFNIHLGADLPGPSSTNGSLL